MIPAREDYEHTFGQAIWKSKAAFAWFAESHVISKIRVSLQLESRAFDIVSTHGYRYCTAVELKQFQPCTHVNETNNDVIRFTLPRSIFQAIQIAVCGFSEV